MLEASSGVEKKLNQIFLQLERKATLLLRREGFAPSRQRHERSLAVRYKGQSFELEIRTTSGNIAAAFHRAHEERYGYAQEANVVEIVSARVRSTGLVEKTIAQKRSFRRRTIPKPARIVNAYLHGKRLKLGVYEREDLPAGAEIADAVHCY